MTELAKLLMGADPAAKLRALYENRKLHDVLPEIAALDINDKHSHKHKNNLFHSFQVLRQAIDQETEPDLVLRLAALFHDVGKPATRVMINGKPTFRNHETVGASMVRKILKREGFDKETISLVSELITHHMRSFGFDANKWTDSAIRRLANDLSSKEQLKRLFIIFKADVTTKYADRRQLIWGKADKLYERIEEVTLKDELAKRRPAINGNELMELFNLAPGRELGRIMKFLNTEEGLALSRDEAINKARELLQ